MNLLLLIMNMLLLVNILIPLSTAQQCKNCGKGNVAAKRIKMINKSTFTRIAGVELNNIFQITPEKNMTVCAQRCDANLTCTVFEFNKPHKLCLLSTSYAVIDKDLVSNAFATAIFVKIVGTFKKQLPKGPESCLSRDEYSDYLITNVTEFLKNGTKSRNDTTSTLNGATSNLPSTTPSDSSSASEITSSESSASTQGTEINHGTSGGTTTSDVETTSTPTDSDPSADATTPSDVVTVEEQKATTPSGLSPTASKIPTAQATETSSTIRGTTTTSQPLRPSDPASSSSVASSTTTVTPTSTPSSKSSYAYSDSTTAEAQKETTDPIDSTTENVTSEKQHASDSTTIGETEASATEETEGETDAIETTRGSTVDDKTTVSTTEEAKKDNVETGPTTTTTKKPAPKWYDSAHPTGNVNCTDDLCTCKKDFELKVTVGNINYTAVSLGITRSGWYVKGERGSLKIGAPTATACVPSDRTEYDPNICKAPVVVNGKYTERGVVCDEETSFKKAVDEALLPTWCYDATVGICKENSGYYCGPIRLYNLAIYYCE